MGQFRHFNLKYYNNPMSRGQIILTLVKSIRIKLNNSSLTYFSTRNCCNREAYGRLES